MPAKVLHFPVATMEPTMRLLITSAACPLVQSLAPLMGDRHRVQLTERSAMPDVAGFAQCALNHDEATDRLVKGVEAIVHVAEPLPGEDDNQQLDYLTRCTYNLYLAASSQGVKRVVLLSTLDLMTPYPA